MALFTDGPINGTIQLQDYENAILEVASNEGIDLGGKIRLAQDEMAGEVVLFLLRRLPDRNVPWTMRRTTGVRDVVVTDPLRQWHAYKTLAIVYRDAYNSQLNDRYKGKWNEYERLAKLSAEKYFQCGVGLVNNPIPKATLPVLATVPGTGIEATYYVAVAWTGQDGQEGAPSDVVDVRAGEEEVPSVMAVNPPDVARGWNVYLGQAPATLRLQNNGPLPLGGPWDFSGTVIQGNPPSGGQQPTCFVIEQRVIVRG